MTLSAIGAADRAQELRQRWRVQSIRGGWAFPGDWWVPPVDAVVEALIDGVDPAPAVTLLGGARADSAVGIEEAMDDLTALCGLVGLGDEAPARLIRALVVGWFEAATVHGLAEYCEDPLTRLTTPAYLRTRLAEVYREASRSGLPVNETHALVVVGVDRVEAGWDRGMRLLVAGECLRATFSGGETLSATGPGHVVALVTRERALAPRVAVLRELLSEQLGPDHPTRVWLEGLPRHEHLADSLLLELAR